MASMLEQAIIDADQLKETAKKTAEETIVEKYQDEIKEAVEKILEQDEDEELAPAAPGEIGDPELDLSFGEETEEAALVPDGEGSLDLVEDLPSTQLGDEEQVITIDLNKLEEMMSQEADQDVRVDSDELLEREKVAEEILLAQPGDEEIDISEKELKEILDPEIELDESNLADIIAEMLGEEAEEAAADLEESDADTSEETLEESEEELEEKKKTKTEPLAGRAGDPKKVDKPDFKGLKKGTRYTESFKKENKTLLKEQTKLNNKVQLLEEKLNKYGTVVDKLKNKLNEGNLTNAKLLYQNRILSSVSLNERQKNKIVEAISNVTTVEEAKLIFETLQSAVGSSKKNRKQESLNEVVSRSSSAFIPRKEAQPRVDTFAERMKTLAGLK